MNSTSKVLTVMFTVVISLILSLLWMSWFEVNSKNQPIIEQHVRLSQPSKYVITIKNEHDVFISNNIDTIQLLLENAYCLTDEQIIYAKVKNYPKQ